MFPREPFNTDSGVPGKYRFIPEEGKNRRNLRGTNIGGQGQGGGKYLDLGIRCPESGVICFLTWLHLDKYIMSLSISFLICEMGIIVSAYVLGFPCC